MDLFGNDGINILTDKGKNLATYYTSFFNYKEAEKILESINSETPWNREKMKMFNNEYLVPRDTAWYGEKAYIYSGVFNKPHSWTPLLFDIKTKVEKKINCSFNSLLLNRYRDGKDKVDWHSDNEKELDKTSPIASLTFGCERDFFIRHKFDKNNKRKEPLKHGSLLVMYPPMQDEWDHAVPKRATASLRINLTFRNVL